MTRDPNQRIGKDQTMASVTYNEVVSANKAYASDFGDKAKLALPPARHFAILTCMDARLDPAKYAGLAEGDAHVIRNAGGRASMMPFARLSSRTSYSGLRNGSSFTTVIVACNSSPAR
jgi:carbonic anhydrase